MYSKIVQILTQHYRGILFTTWLGVNVGVVNGGQKIQPRQTITNTTLTMLRENMLLQSVQTHKNEVCKKNDRHKTVKNLHCTTLRLVSKHNSQHENTATDDKSVSQMILGPKLFIYKWNTQQQDTGLCLIQQLTFGMDGWMDG